MTELTAEIVSKLSPGASKLYLATLVEPGESDAHYRAVTSYKPRWYKKLREELVEAGLVASDVQELSADQQRSEAELRSLGIDGSVAGKFARSCPPEMVQSVVAYVRGRSDIASPAGYAIRILRDRLKEGSNTPIVLRNEPFRGDMQKGQDSLAALPTLSLNPPYRGEDPVAAPMPDRISPMAVGALWAGRAYENIDQAERVDKVTQQRALDGAMLDTDFQLLLYGVCAACGCDPLLRPQTLDDVERLYQAGYRVADVQRFISDVWPTCWPGNKGERASLKALLDYIGFTKHSAPPNDGSAYLADPYFAAKDEEDSLPEVVKYETKICPRCGPAACVCTPIPAYERDMWNAMLGQLQIQLKRSTYDTWLRRAELVGYADGVFTLKVPHHYAKDWIERHLLPSMRRALSDLLSRRSRQDGLSSIEIEIVTEVGYATTS